MSALWSIGYKKLTKKLKYIWYEFGRSGKWSHELWTNIELNKSIPIPKHNNKDIPIWTLKAIINELWISVQEFLDL